MIIRNLSPIRGETVCSYFAFFNVFKAAPAIIDFCFFDNFFSGPSLAFLTEPECLDKREF